MLPTGVSSPAASPACQGRPVITVPIALQLCLSALSPSPVVDVSHIPLTPNCLITDICHPYGLEQHTGCFAVTFGGLEISGYLARLCVGRVPNWKTRAESPQLLEVKGEANVQCHGSNVSENKCPSTISNQQILLPQCAVLHSVSGSIQL
ncbi:hypothetical protein FIBSPDRAFT_887179 [Athelia psychrophila]|uniref:Uncharacterized protein n=1 Tax=Athelia psychrophila TaxID=1759441 RepID=A0A166Q2I4_9AGAM|nr:hypothetical protein FIBSPDRAFT_887179 [Fibularhizoctonia sp. CBS 109695]